MIKQDFIEILSHLGHKQIAFESIPTETDDDELTQAINDPIYHDNHWDLREDVDGEALEKFWDEAADDEERV